MRLSVIFVDFFNLADGGVVRHHDLGYFMRLLDGFTLLALETHPITTMNGNPAQAIRYVGKLNQKNDGTLK